MSYLLNIRNNLQKPAREPYSYSDSTLWFRSLIRVGPPGFSFRLVSDCPSPLRTDLSPPCDGQSVD